MTLATLVLCCDGPLQSWGVQGRFNYRDTHSRPTKSAIVGLIGAAAGTRRGDPPILAATDVSISVRSDRPGRRCRDFHTVGGAHDIGHPKAAGKGRHPVGQAVVTERWYLEDAAFTVALTGDQNQLKAAASALEDPAWQLSLGRRSCPPAAPILVGLTTSDAAELFTIIPLLRNQDAGTDGLVTVAVTTELDGTESTMVADQPLLVPNGGRRRFSPRGETTSTIEVASGLCAGTGPAAWAARRHAVVGGTDV